MARTSQWLTAITAVLALGTGCVDQPDPVVPELDLGSLAFTAEQPLTAEGEVANKTKILRVAFKDPEGAFKQVLVAFYGKDTGGIAWGVDGTTHPARDIYVRRSMNDGLTWTPEVNISKTAMLSSIAADNDGDPLTVPMAFYGDSGKPTVFATGKNVSIIWEDAYAPGGVQNTVVYPEWNQIEVPFRALYIARSKDAGNSWIVQRMTDGSRDAKQSVARGTSAGWVYTWQEDPEGLQPGDAEGPGEGGSGAKVSHGTDIWYTSQAAADFGAGTMLPTPVAVTDNADGNTGASRANLVMFGNAALIGYEETKGTKGTDEGKYIRYQVFSDFLDPLGTDLSDGAGWILSDPMENARRVRMMMLPGGASGPDTGIKIQFIWKQGLYDQGGPSDIMSRIGYIDGSYKGPSDGLYPEQLWPVLAEDATTRAGAMLADPALNLSSDAGLDAITDENAFEDARAHRGIIRGDSIFMGYIWTPDWAVARYTDIENYDFWIRRSDDGGVTWTEPYNLSQLDDKGINVREPRIVGTPKSTDPDNPQDPNVAFVAWGSEVNEYEHMSEGTRDLDIYLTRTADLGQSFLETTVLAGGDTAQYESQLRTTPDGTTLWAVWNEADPEVGDVTAQFARADYETPEEEPGEGGPQ